MKKALSLWLLFIVVLVALPIAVYAKDNITVEEVVNAIGENGSEIIEDLDESLLEGTTYYKFSCDLEGFSGKIEWQIEDGIIYAGEWTTEEYPEGLEQKVTQALNGIESRYTWDDQCVWEKQNILVVYDFHESPASLWIGFKYSYWYEFTDEDFYYGDEYETSEYGLNQDSENEKEYMPETEEYYDSNFDDENVDIDEEKSGKEDYTDTDYNISEPVAADEKWVMVGELHWQNGSEFNKITIYGYDEKGMRTKKESLGSETFNTYEYIYDKGRVVGNYVYTWADKEQKEPWAYEKSMYFLPDTPQILTEKETYSEVNGDEPHVTKFVCEKEGNTVYQTLQFDDGNVSKNTSEYTIMNDGSILPVLVYDLDMKDSYTVYNENGFRQYYRNVLGLEIQYRQLFDVNGNCCFEREIFVEDKESYDTYTIYSYMSLSEYIKNPEKAEEEIIKSYSDCTYSENWAKNYLSEIVDDSDGIKLEVLFSNFQPYDEFALQIEDVVFRFGMTLEEYENQIIQSGYPFELPIYENYLPPMGTVSFTMMDHGDVVTFCNYTDTPIESKKAVFYSLYGLNLDRVPELEVYLPGGTRLGSNGTGFTNHKLAQSFLERRGVGPVFYEEMGEGYHLDIGSGGYDSHTYYITDVMIDFDYSVGRYYISCLDRLDFRYILTGEIIN